MIRALPTVTAIMAAYNYAKFIPRTLDSALCQDYPPGLLDIVVVDDGSTDDTPQVLADYSARYPDRIRVVRQDNAGYVAATNRAAAEARGEVIAILDADDLWPADKTRRQVERLLERDEIGLVYCDTEIIDAYDVVRHISLWRWWQMNPQRGSGAFADIMTRPGNVALASTIILRNELAQHAFPIPKGAPYVDWWVTARIAAVAEIDWVDDVRVGYRQHGENLTLGATGMLRVRETLKCAEVRRQLLVHGAADHLTDKQLLDAWKAWEGAALTAVNQAGSAYVPLFPISDEENAASALHHRRSKDATIGGDLRTAFRESLVSVACNPSDGTAREWFYELADLGARAIAEPADVDPLGEARNFVTLAYAEELVAEPQILAAYASVVCEEDDATLAVAAIGMDDAAVIREVGHAANRAGLNISKLPDLLLVTQGGAAARLELERRANAVLTRRKPKLEAPAFAPEKIGELRTLIAA